MAVPVLLAVGDEDVRCLETKPDAQIRASQRWSLVCPNTGHAINLEEPAAFNAQVESFLGAVERGSWRHGFPRTEIDPSLGLSRGACGDHSLLQIDQEAAGADVVRLHHG